MSVTDKDRLINTKIGKLFVMDRIPDLTAGPAPLRARLLVHCDCGNRLLVKRAYLTRQPNPKTTCGNCSNCAQRGCQPGNHQCMDFPIAKSIKLYHPEYSCWIQMKERTGNPKHVSYKRYGGRGIIVCAEWLDSQKGFWNFLNDMGPRPSMVHTLDREDSDGSYTPANTRWATIEEQSRNKVNTIRFRHPDFPLKEWTIGEYAAHMKWSYHKAYNLLHEKGIL